MARPQAGSHPSVIGIIAKRHLERAPAGELFVLRWGCFDPKLCLIELKETVYKGKIRPWGKTKGSLTKVPIPEELAQELQACRRQRQQEQQSKKRWEGPTADRPEAFIFPGPLRWVH